MARLAEGGHSAWVNRTTKEVDPMKLLTDLFERAGLAKKAQTPDPVEHPNFWMYY